MKMQGGRGRGYSGYSYANPSPGMRRRAAKQTMAVEPESLAAVSQALKGMSGREAAAAPRGLPARRGPWRGRGEGERWRWRWREREGASNGNGDWGKKRQKVKRKVI